MRVLVLETDRHIADDSIAQLQAAGHSVARCHGAEMPAFPCNSLFDGGQCPLEHGPAVDVVLDHRAHAYPRPRDSEDGVSCALRYNIPLVAGGISVLSPFEPWITSTVEDQDVVAACETAVNAPLERLAAPARALLRWMLELDPAAASADVVVHRHGSRLHAIATIPADAGDVEDTVAVRIAGALRAVDPHASTIDVTVTRNA